MNPAVFDLGDSTIGGAVSNVVLTQGPTDDFIAGSAVGAALMCNFTYGAGGATVKVDIETSLDQGFSWIPIARFAFAQASLQKLMNVNASTSRLTSYQSPAVLPDDTAIDGVMGDRLRAKLTTTGTYTGNTSISVRAVLR